MPKDYSPFTPGQPVPEEFFVGRLAEVEKLLHKAAAAASGRLQVTFLSGERGIGKSSLASFVRIVGQKRNKLLGVHTFLGGVESVEEMARRVFDRILKESADGGWLDSIKELFGRHIREVGLFGVTLEFAPPADDLRRLADNFSQALRTLLERVAIKQGVFLVLDDINGLAESAAFANWLKSLVDEIATSNRPLPLCLTLVGLDERRHGLVKLQPSLARVFDLVEIKAWSASETERFFRTAFEKVGVSVTKSALSLLAGFTGGLPVLAHEIGDATFAVDKDDCIDDNDALLGIGIAADVVGRKHLEPQVFRAIRSQRYRAILRKLASPEAFGPSFKRADLASRLTHEEGKVLDNFLAKFKSLGVVSPDHEVGPGWYRFTNELHRLYFMLEAKRGKAGAE